MTIRWWHYAIAVGVAIVAVCMLAACSHVASDLERRQREVQDCILAGGHAHLGPGQTILCD